MRARLALCALLSAATAEAVAPLPQVWIDPSGISISGLSSGADFAVQFQVAFSSVVSGLGVFAGQPYHCAVHRFAGDKVVPPCYGVKDDGSAPSCVSHDIPSPAVPFCENCPPPGSLLYDHCKRHPELVNVSELVEYAASQAALGTIDPLRHLKDTPVYLYRGSKDQCYLAGSVEHTGGFFSALGGKLHFNLTTPSQHAWPTDGWGGPCGSREGPDEGMIENCHYDGPGAALNHIYGPLKPKVAAAAGGLMQFDQRPFWTADNNGTDVWNATTPHVTGLAPSGYLYVPAACECSTQCRLHVSLHGCGVDEIYDEAVHHLGFQEWGEANHIAILFPRMQPHGGTWETAAGCWDAYGQSGRDYALQSGAQMNAVRQMIAAVGGPPMQPTGREPLQGKPKRCP